MWFSREPSKDSGSARAESSGIGITGIVIMRFVYYHDGRARWLYRLPDRFFKPRQAAPLELVALPHLHTNLSSGLDETLVPELPIVI